VIIRLLAIFDILEFFFY